LGGAIIKKFKYLLNVPGTSFFFAKQVSVKPGTARVILVTAKKTTTVSNLNGFMLILVEYLTNITSGKSDLKLEITPWK
jgi:hypothetical protein